MTRDAALLIRVGEVLLEGPKRPLSTPIRWLVGTDAFDMCSEDVARRLYEPLSTNMERLGAFLSAPVETVVCDDGSSLVEWFDVFRTCQGHEVWQTHGDWVRDVHPMFGPGVKDRFEMASQITDAEVAVARHRRRLISGRLDKLLADSVLMIPTACDVAPVKGQLSADELQLFRTKTLALTSIAGLGDLPQVTIPVPSTAGDSSAPIGISLVGPRGSDEALLALASRVSAAADLR